MIYLILGFYLLSRIYPYLFTAVPMGYDPGLYLDLFRQYQAVGLWQYTQLASWFVENPPLLPFLVRLVTPVLSPEWLILPLILLAAASLFGAVYWLMRELYGRKTGLVAVTLLSLSIIQYKFYWYYYLKNIFAVALMLVLIVLVRRKSRWAWLVAPAIILLHQPTAILMVILLVLVALRQQPLRKFSLICLGWAGLAFCGYYLPNYELTLLPYLPSFLKSLVPGFLAGNFGQASGTFYSLGQAALYALAYLPLALVTLWRKTWRSAPELVILLVASFIFSCGIFLSRRFIPVLDLMVILLAAITLAQVSKRVLISYLLILAGIFGLLFPSQSASLIADDELAEIKLLTTTEPEAYILVADNEYTPWIYGYSGRRAIAPGFGQFDIYWTNADWNQFWLSNQRQTEIDLLKKLPQPLYIYLGDRQRQIKFKPLGDCFSRYSWHVYKFRCGGKL